MVELLQQMTDRIVHLERMLVQERALSGAAYELAADARMAAKSSLGIAMSAMRQTAKCCLGKLDLPFTTHLTVFDITQS